MTAARPFRWLLSLLALAAPIAATTGRAGDAGSEPVALRSGDAHVVFRHYL